MFDTATPERIENKKPQYEYSDDELAQRDASYNESLYGSVEQQHDFDAWEAELTDVDAKAEPGVTDRNRGGIDIVAIDGSIADKTALGQKSDERRQHIAEAHDTLHNNDSLMQRQFNEQVGIVATQIETIFAVSGMETPDTNDIAERLEGEMIQDTLDGDNPNGMNSNVNTDNLNEARRAVEAAYTLEQVEDGETEILTRLDDSTAGKVIEYQQGVREKGAAEQVSNEGLALLGKKIEQGAAATDAGETVSYIGEDGQVHQVEKNNRARNLAEAWIDGNWNEGGDVDHTTRDKVYYYLETAHERENLQDPEVRDRVMSKIAHMITNEAHDSDREKATV